MMRPGRLDSRRDRARKRRTRHRTPTRILIADDHPIFREGLRRVLTAGRGFDVVGEAADAVEAVRLAVDLQPDVLLLDASMPHGSSSYVLEKLARAAPVVRTIVLTAATGPNARATALERGARAVLAKGAAINFLFECIDAVLQGEYSGPQRDVPQPTHLMRPEDTPTPARAKEGRFGLTPRQLEIVSAVVKGESNWQIARRLSVREDTIKHHLSCIFDKLGVFSRVELTVFAINHGLAANEEGSSAPKASKA